MRQIALRHNKVIILDDEDFDRLSHFHWIYRGERNRSDGYAVRKVKVDKKWRNSYLHREIMNPPPGYEVIFKNHDRLDCRRANLAVVTKEDARRHHRVRHDSQSGIKGVRFNPDGGTWSAFVYRSGHCYGIGTYYTQEQAILAYEDELRKENPDLHDAPERVERRVESDRGNPDAVPANG
jgi:hypothetical protein